jgi:hypothetical protein
MSATLAQVSRKTQISIHISILNYELRLQKKKKRKKKKEEECTQRHCIYCRGKMKCLIPLRRLLAYS